MICYSIRPLEILPDSADHVIRALRQEAKLDLHWFKRKGRPP